MNSPPPYRGPLPEPLASVRRQVLATLWTRRAPGTIDVGGFSLLTESSLPDPRPVLGYSPTAMLLSALSIRPGERVLDLECGAGWITLVAKRAGAHVVSVDMDEAAAICLRRSSLVAGLGEPDVRVGEGLDAVKGETFDVVAWTPPFLDGAGSGDRVRLGDRARITRTLKGVLPRLARGGRLLFPFPDRDATPWLHDALTSIGYRFSAVRYARPPVIGPVRVYEAWPAQHGLPGEVSQGEALPGAGWVLRDR